MGFTKLLKEIHHMFFRKILKLRHQKTCLYHKRTTKKQISLHIPCLDSTIHIAVFEILLILLASISEQDGLNLTWLHTTADMFAHDAYEVHNGRISDKN